MFLGACTYHSSEKLTITKKNDSLTILPEFNERAFSSKKFVKQKSITIHENDSLWRFGEFIKKYKLENVEGDKPIFEMKLDTTSIKFYTKGIFARDNIVADYCIVMRQLIPSSKYHFFGEINEITNKMEIEQKRK